MAFFSLGFFQFQKKEFHEYPRILNQVLLLRMVDMENQLIKSQNLQCHLQESE